MSSRIHGFAMIEILVTMVVLLVGLLGLAGVTARAGSAEVESYQRVQGILLAQDMVDRLNANRKMASCYSNGGSGRTVGKGYSGTPTCAGGTPEAALAVSDVTLWDQLLKGSAETSGSTKLGAMIDARGCIERIDSANSIYRISVAWQGLAKTTAPVNALDCGKDQYGDNRMRRLITVTVRIGNLS